jgi:hypothetical protein
MSNSSGPVELVLEESAKESVARIAIFCWALERKRKPSIEPSEPNCISFRGFAKATNSIFSPQKG